MINLNDSTPMPIVREASTPGLGRSNIKTIELCTATSPIRLYYDYDCRRILAVPATRVAARKNV